MFDVNAHHRSACIVFLRAAQYEGRSSRRVTSVTHARSVFIWWRGSVPRGSTSTGSVSAVPPAARPCDRELMPSTLYRVRVSSDISSRQNLIYIVLKIKEYKVQYLSGYFVLTVVVFLQGNCIANFILINAKMGQTYRGTFLYVQ